MSLPIHFMEELRARTPMVQLVARRVPLVRSGKFSKGCCPFHVERSASFHVYDDHFHCFGCGAHGDCISFVMQTQRCSFPEAVAQLAAEVGLSVPHDETSRVTRAQQQVIGDLLNAAQKWFQTCLHEPQGAPALAYLRSRGVTNETIERFGLGWSGQGRGALERATGASIEDLISAGLMTRRDDDGVAIEMFRKRLMFPITDQAGRPISFGGRLLGNGEPKYINGPATQVYGKSAALYGINFAREAFAEGKQLIVVEGYMDVIAMHQAGQAGAVAPLGTALTDEHLAEIWRLSPSPVLCFDGDSAGARAVLRTITLALPRIMPGRTLRIVQLPEKEDPDSLIRRGGPGAIDFAISEAQALDVALANALKPDEGGPFGNALLCNRLSEAADSVANATSAQAFRASLMTHYFEGAWTP
jgi:DNA primase